MPKRTTGLLQKQRPRRRRSFLRSLRYVIPILVVATVVTIGFGVVSRFRRYNFFDSQAQNSWSIEVQSTTLPAKLRADIAKTAQDHLKGYLPQFSAVASRLRNNFGMAEVAIQRTGLTSATIRLTQRTPAFRIEGKARTYLSTDLVVFESDYVDGEGLPTLSTLSTWSSSRSIDGDEPTVPKVAAEAASKALVALGAQKFIGKRFTWDGPRGIGVTLADSGIEVLFGMPPYENKVERLVKVLKDRTQEQGLPRRIELDFEGKAFIKESDPERDRL